MNKNQKENLKEEYFDASSNMRHYSNMRFAQLTLFSAYTAGLTTLAFTSKLTFLPLLFLIFNIWGIIVGIVFWIMEERAASMFHSYRRRAEELEILLEFSQHRNRPEGERMKTRITSANAVRILYISTILFWLVSIIINL